ncbi:phage tail domain-containing protein [Intestinimonas butyriciproducens]|uniref:phage tail domain-containing protein n=1 Tax=Intestinimonas butyriciproducens TaxID=1297617 RepID=UPI001896F31F|nr:phage tail domain-containing protein [Intestinimonas butyriciproducens]MDB7829110.1 hypothetical protein [Intestinimonas butyriciproducens]
MFQAYEFSYAGESSYQYGLMLYDFGGRGQADTGFGNKASIVESRTNTRIQPIHFGTNYHQSPLEFKLIFGAQHSLDRYELQNIAMWLTGHSDYQWLSIDQPDLDHVVFRCLITALTPLTHGWLPMAFEATVRCDCPYAYGHPFTEHCLVRGETSLLFRNESTVREYLKPTLAFVPEPGATGLTIVNKSDGGRTFSLTGLPADDLQIQVDNNSGVIQELSHGYNLYDGFNLNFFRLVPGGNDLEITGDGMLTISGRFLYNVAA